MFIGWSIDIAREQSPSRAWLESTMARGILLLVANLAGVMMSLAQQYLQQ